MFALQLQYPIFTHEAGVIALNNQLGSRADTLANFMLTRLARDRVRGLSAIMPVAPNGGAVGNNITLTGTNWIGTTGFKFNDMAVSFFATLGSDPMGPKPVYLTAVIRPVR